MRLRINVSIEPEQTATRNEGYGNLNLTQEFRVEGIDFLSMCQILGQFNALAEKLKKEKP
jgi:hypothetical protein